MVCKQVARCFEAKVQECSADALATRLSAKTGDLKLSGGGRDGGDLAGPPCRPGAE